MSLVFYERNLASVTPLRKRSKVLKLVSAGGSDLTTIGHVKTKIKLGGCALPLEFCVIENLTQDIILGAEFFERTGMLIDYARKRLSLYHGSIVVPLLTAVDPNCIVCTTCNICIPPKHEALIPIKTPGGTGFDAGITEALPQTSKRCLLYTSPSPRDRQKSRMPSSA